MALTALDGVKVGGRAGGRGAAKELGRLQPPTWEEVESLKRWPIQSTTALNLITVTFALVMAAAIVFLLAQVVPQLADLMMPPPLSGTR